MSRLITVQVQFECKIKILGQNQAYREDLTSLTHTKKIGTTIRFPEGLENTPFEKSGHNLDKIEIKSG